MMAGEMDQGAAGGAIPRGDLALSLKGLHKSYGIFRPFKALDDLSFSVPRGAICGVIGPNGAGKTTTFSVVSGFLRLSAGEVDILGEGPFDPMRFKGRLGILPQDADIGLRHTPREFLEHLGRLQGLSGAEAVRQAGELLERLNLGARAESPLESLSHGMRRRVAVGSALIGSPELVLLDEPMSGLDPVQVQSLRAFLSSLRGSRTLVISSHNLAELELICDYVVVLADGRCVKEGSTAEVTGQARVVEWSLGGGDVHLEALRDALPGHRLTLVGEVLTQEAPSLRELDTSSITIAQRLAEGGVAIRGVRRGQSLERAVLGAPSTDPLGDLL